MVTDCTIRYEQELTEWEEAVEEVEQGCDQKLKLVCNFAVKIAKILSVAKIKFTSSSLTVKK